jgi:hypothetical protein
MYQKKHTKKMHEKSAVMQKPPAKGGSAGIRGHPNQPATSSSSFWSMSKFE